MLKVEINTPVEIEIGEIRWLPDGDGNSHIVDKKPHLVGKQGTVANVQRFGGVLHYSIKLQDGSFLQWVTSAQFKAI